MAKREKTRPINFRASESYENMLNAYAEIVGLSRGELIRVAINEYIANHPVKAPVPKLQDTIKPGGH